VPAPLVLQIADALIAKSVAAGFTATGLLTDVGKDWHAEDRSPAAYLGDAGERNEDGPTQSISPQAGFFFHTIVKGEAPTRSFLALYKALKDAVDADPKLGALVFRARVTGYLSDKTVPNITARVHVADIFVEVEYRHAKGAS
jgi:hypothetical protein